MRQIKLPRFRTDSNLRMRKVGEDWEREFELYWGVDSYEIRETAFAPMADRSEHLPGGFFVWRGWPEKPGGAGEYGFIPGKGWRLPFGKLYRPTDCAREILIDFTRHDPEKPEDLLHFVNLWGCLGVGGTTYGRGGFDSVNKTRDAFRHLRALTDQLGRLKELEPPNDEGMQKKGRQRIGRTESDRYLEWTAFAQHLNPHLEAISPAIRPEPGRGVRAIWRPKRLLDVLYLELWVWATDYETFGRCPECAAIFARSRTNQLYCSRACVNRAGVRRWRRALRNPKVGQRRDRR